MAPAIDIEQLLIWAFMRERAQLGGESLRTMYPEDSIVRCERVNVLGGFITGGFVGSDTAADAETVAMAVGELRPALSALVVRMARSGSRPDCRTGAFHRFEPTCWDDGRGSVERCPYADNQWWWEDTGKGRRKRWSEWVPVRQMDAPESVSMMRRVYVEWWAALVELHDALEGRMCDWHLTAHFPPQYPWDDLGRAA